MTGRLPDDPDELALVAADFPAFEVWRSVTAHRSRYVAQSRTLDGHPHMVVTDDLAELAAALREGTADVGSFNA